MKSKIIVGACLLCASLSSFAAEETKPLQFMLYRHLNGVLFDGKNATCFSNVVTVPGPKGWGTKNANYDEARAVLKRYHDEFARQCEKWGAASTGPIQYSWNERYRPDGANEAYNTYRSSYGNRQGEVLLNP
jgi:hypothetical protein